VAFDYEALAAGLSEDNKRQTLVLESCLKRIAELEAALRQIADMQSDDEPVAYSWGLDYFKRAHAIAREALDK